MEKETETPTHKLLHRDYPETRVHGTGPHFQTPKLSKVYISKHSDLRYNRGQ